MLHMAIRTNVSLNFEILNKKISKFNILSKRIRKKCTYLENGESQEVNGRNFRPVGQVVHLYGISLIFDLQGDIWVIWCTCLKIACNSTTADSKSKRIGFFRPSDTDMHRGSFELAVFRVIWNN